MAFNRTDLGSASAKITIDMTQPAASVAQFRSIASQINAALESVKKASSAGLAPNAFGVSTSLDQSMQKQAAAAMKLDRQRQAALTQQQRAQDSMVDDALKGVDTWAAAERKRHDAQMAYLQAEAQKFDALRNKTGDTVNMQGNTQILKPAGDMNLTQPMNLGNTQAMTQAVQPLQEATQQIQAQVTQSFAPISQTIQQQIRVITAQLAEAKNQVAQQMNLFQTAAAGTPASVKRSGVEEAAGNAKQSVLELEGQLKELKTAVAQAGGDPQALHQLDPALQQLTAEARTLIDSGFIPLGNAVQDFSAKAEASKSGLQGYFNAVRQGLESLNETSLAANLQEVSFRLLPLGLGAGAATKQGVDVAQQLQEAQINLAQFTGGGDKAAIMMQHLTDEAHKFGAPMLDTLNVMTRYAPLLKEANIPLDDAYNIAVRLSTLNPAQGVEGALFGINEALAGQWRSLQTRFNIPTTELKKLVSDQGFIGGMDTFLNQLGKTTQLAEQFGQTSRASFTRLSDSVNNFLAHSMQPFLDGMDQGADRLTNFFNSMANGNSIIATAVGGLLLFTNTVTSALLSLGQFALAFNAIKALASPLGLGAKLIDVLPTGIVSAFTSAAPMITGILSSAISLAVKGGLLAGSVVGGAFIGTRIAAAFNVGGTTDPNEQASRLNKIIFTVIFEIISAISVVASVIKNAGDAIGTALDLIGTTLAGGANDIAIKITEAIRNIGTQFNIDVLKNFGTDPNLARQDTRSRFVIVNPQGAETANFPAPGVQGLGSNPTPDQTNAFNAEANRRIAEANAAGWIKMGDTFKFIEGYQERAQRDLSELSNHPTLGKIIQDGLDAARDASKPLFNLMFDQGQSGAGVGEAAGGALSGGGAPDNADVLEQVYSAAISHMIQTTRELEDRTLSAQREEMDFAIQRSRAVQDFNTQMLNAEADYQASRMQQQDDYNRQSAQAEQQLQDQQKKQAADFQKQELRAQQDFQIAQQRLSRSIDDSISARDFLSAQKTVQQMKDAQDDYDLADKRRKEDYQAQQDEQQANFDEQKKQRDDDFKRQQQQADDAHKLQQQRQAAAFALSQLREDQDRQLRLQRQEQDYAIADARREFDYQLQIAQLDSSMNTMTFIWQYGLGSIEGLVNKFFADLGISAAQLANGPGYSPAPTPHFATGAWNVPYQMPAIIDPGEMIAPAPVASQLRAMLSGGSGGASGDSPITIYVDARGSDLNSKRVNEIKQELVDGIAVAQQRRSSERRSGRSY